MDLRNYFQKIKEIESTIVELFTLVVSLETGDGGKAGTPTEVSRALAAKMIVEGLVRLADAAEKNAYYGQKQPADPPTNTPATTNTPASTNTPAPAKK
jgi:hypothetical protein